MPANPPQRYVLGLAYQAGRDDRIIKGKDGARDYFTEAELEKAAWAFMRGPRQVGIGHADGTLDAAEVVESYIYRGEPWQFGDVVVKSGDWLIGAILDERSWSMAERGLLTGFSPQGVAKRRQPTR